MELLTPNIKFGQHSVSSVCTLNSKGVCRREGILMLSKPLQKKMYMKEGNGGRKRLPGIEKRGCCSWRCAPENIVEFLVTKFQLLLQFGMLHDADGM